MVPKQLQNSSPADIMRIDLVHLDTHQRLPAALSGRAPQRGKPYDGRENNKQALTDDQIIPSRHFATWDRQIRK
jgi:hypothetical protein